MHPSQARCEHTYFFLVGKLFFLFGKLLSLFGKSFSLFGKLFSLFVNFSLVGKIVAQFVFLDFYVPFSPFSVRYIYFYLEFDQNKKSFCERPPLSFNKSFPLAGLEILLLFLWRFPPLLLRLPCQVQLHLLILESFQAEEREHSAAKRGLTWKSRFAKKISIFFITKVVGKFINDHLAPIFWKSVIALLPTLNFRAKIIQKSPFASKRSLGSKKVISQGPLNFRF